MRAQPALAPRTALTPAIAAIHASGSWMNALDEGRDTLRAMGGVQHFTADQEIFADGDDAELFFKVVSGVVRTCKFLSDGRRQIEAFYGAGDVFGFEAGERYSLTAEAVSDCNLVSYRRRSVQAAAPRDEILSGQLISYAMHSVAHAQKHAFLLGRRSAAEKVASFLLDWAPRSGGALVTLAMSRQDIADYLGLTIETVSRTLSQMERDGLIIIPSAREIRLVGRQALEDLTA